MRKWVRFGSRVEDSGLADAHAHGAGRGAVMKVSGDEGEGLQTGR